MTISFNTLRISLLIFNFLLIGNLIFAQPFSIGHTSTTFVDDSRNNREIPVEIYYPADENGDDVDVNSGCFPVISFGHGFLMNSIPYENIRETLVAEGYIMVFVDTETGISVNHGAYGLDLAFALDEMISLSLLFGGQFEDRICGRHIVMGHSMGGGASVLATMNSNNISGYIGLAPAETDPSAIAAAADADVAALIFSGTSDGVTPPDQHHIPIYENFTGEAAGCKTIVNITGGAHCFYANEDFICDFGETTASTGITITRAEQQEIMFDYTMLWLEHFNNGEDVGVLLSNLFLDDRITFQTTCFSTDTKESFIAELDIYPNPTTGVISIDNVANDLIGKTYVVYDMLGKPVLNGLVDGAHVSVDFGSLNGGVYSLVIDGVGRRVVRL